MDFKLYDNTLQLRRFSVDWVRNDIAIDAYGLDRNGHMAIDAADPFDALRRWSQSLDGAPYFGTLTGLDQDCPVTVTNTSAVSFRVTSDYDPNSDAPDADNYLTHYSVRVMSVRRNL